MEKQPLTLESLDPRAAYCVVSSVAMRESTIMRGERIQREAKAGRGFRRFLPGESIWEGYVRVHCGDFFLALWRDPTRHELNVDETFCGDPTDAQVILDPEAVPAPAAVVDSPWELCDVLRTSAMRFAESLYAEFQTHPSRHWP